MARFALAAAMVLALTLSAACRAAGAEAKTPRPGAWPLFALCFDTHDSQKRPLAQQAALLKELGYDGAGHLWLDGVRDRLKTLDEAGLRLFQVYVRASVAPGKPPYDPRLKETLGLLEGRGVMVALLVEGLPPADAAGDPRAVEVIGQIADMARPLGIRVALYPHTGFWLERVEQAVRVAGKVDRPNVGVMFNLCHWLKTGRDADPRRVLRLAMPSLLCVTLHGADTAEEIRAGRGNWIQPLGSGSFDVSGLLKTLRDLGYAGPIGLQCYGLGGDARDHLARSMAAWRKLNPGRAQAQARTVKAPSGRSTPAATRTTTGTTGRAR